MNTRTAWDQALRSLTGQAVAVILIQDHFGTGHGSGDQQGHLGGDGVVLRSVQQEHRNPPSFSRSASSALFSNSGLARTPWNGTHGHRCTNDVAAARKG